MHTNPFWLSALPRDKGSESITQRPISIKVNIFFGSFSLQTSSQFDPPKDLIERQLDADVKLSEIRVLGAYDVKSHLIND